MDTIIWLKQTILRELDWVKYAQFPQGYTTDEFLSIWIVWLADNEFVKIFRDEFGDPVGYIILRPVRLERIFEPEINYFELLWEFDPDGTVAWIDSLYAPGRYDLAIDVLRATRRIYVAWTHPDRLFLTKISDLSRRAVPVKSEIKRALIKSYTV